MAGKNAGPGNKNRTGDATDTTSGDDDERAIRELIDSPGNGEADRKGDTTGNETGRNDSKSGSSGSESGSSAITGNGSGDESNRTRTRTSDNGRTRNSSSDARRTENGNGTATEKTRQTADNVSRQQLKPPKKPKVDSIPVDIPGNNKEIIGDVFQFCFWGIGQATGIPEWELEDDDAETIGENGDKWLKSLGPKRAKNVINVLKKAGPSIAFFGSLGMALVPRVKLTVEKAKHGAIRPPQERNGSGNSPNSTSTGDTSIDRTIATDGPAGFNARPFTAQDIGEVTQGHAFENAGG